MGFDSGGTFSRYGGATIWQGDSSSGKKIESKRHDDHDQELANGLTECLTRTGKGVPAVNISWGGKKIINLAEPTSPGDAATKDYVDTLTGWTTSKYISGADANGRLNFTALSGVNGITWTYVDMSFVARHAKASEASNRLVINPNVAPNTTTGLGDVIVFDEFGNINASGKITNNLSWDGSVWRTINYGYGSLLEYRSGGDFRLSSNDVATITNNYAVATLREFAALQNNAGNAVLTLSKSAPFGTPLVQKAAYIQSFVGTPALPRWVLYMADAAVESGGGTGRVGSDFSLYSYRNDGDSATRQRALHINRNTRLATFDGAITSAGTITGGNLTTTGVVTANTTFKSSDTQLILSTTLNGTIYLRPNGDASTVDQVTVNTNGDLILQATNAAATGGVYAGRGLRSKGSYVATAYGANWLNLQYTGGKVYVWVDATNMGNIQWAAMSDARLQRNVSPLASVWDKVKALKPISFQQAAFGDITQEEDTEQWGFASSHVRNTLTHSAADGEPDATTLSGVNPLTMLAALTKALQEAMARIEALEAAA